MFNASKNKVFSALLVFIIAIIILVITAACLQFKIIDALRVPLRVTSDFAIDARALLAYRFILDENEKLKRELAVTTAQGLAANEVKQENERLKKLLSFKEQAQFSTVAARVIARDPNNWSRGIVIDKGSIQGIKPGNVVITEAGLAGRVVEASGSAAKIILINDSNSSVSAIIQRSRDDGLVTGTLFGALLLRYLDKESDVIDGDIILTSGFTGTYPPFILIGRVASVKDDPQGLGKYAIVTPFVNLKRMEEVLVIIK